MKSWGELKAAVRAARKAGFRVDGRLELDPQDLRRTAHIATRGGISSVSELTTALDFAFDGYFAQLMRPPGQARPEPWGADPAFIFQLLVIRAVVARIDEDVLYEAGWFPSMARKGMAAARANALAADVDQAKVAS